MEHEKANHLPDFFAEMLAESYGKEDVQRIIEGSIQRRKTSLRANTLKADRNLAAQALTQAGIAFSQPAFYQDAFQLEEARERDLWEMEIYKEGGVYLQSLSSMIPPLVLGAPEACDILDMCAAPGGKTCQLAALSEGKAYITACEMITPRAQKLRYNLDKQGASRVNLMQQDSRKLDDFFRFDRILLDTPCSGSGTLRGFDPKTKKNFTPKLLEKCLKQQRALLPKGLSLLKPGGILVYSTCSVFPEENEQQILAALKQVSKIGKFEIKPFDLDGIQDMPKLPCQIEEALTLCPTREYEGFFVCKIERIG